jgi:hypothetical protein
MDRTGFNTYTTGLQPIYCLLVATSLQNIAAFIEMVKANKLDVVKKHSRQGRKKALTTKNT